MRDGPPQRALLRRRVVLLGASNLVRGISTVVEIARQLWGGPLDILAALGHGRSYGSAETYVLMRGLPGILACGLWKALDEGPQVPTASLLTDIGNDILYGANVQEIATWIEQCVERLATCSDRIAITQLPLESIAHVRPWKFLVMRSLLFPQSRLGLEEAVLRAAELNRALLEMAPRYNAILVKPRAAWYGFDPIHVTRRCRPEMWGEILSAWRDDEAEWNYVPSIRRWWLLRSMRPERRRVFGIVQRQSQPARRLADGTRVSFY